MRTVRPVSEDEVIAAFLRAEIESERHDRGIMKENFAPTIGLARSWTLPDLEDLDENTYRRTLLGRVRGWGRGVGMFRGFPERVGWELVTLTPEELAEVRYIAWDWSLQRSGGTRLATENARRIRAGAFPETRYPALLYHEPIARRRLEGVDVADEPNGPEHSTRRRFGVGRAFVQQLAAQTANQRPASRRTRRHEFRQLFVAVGALQ